jgi:hypothetical protein
MVHKRLVIKNKPNNWETLAFYKKINFYKTVLTKDFSFFVDKLNAKAYINSLNINGLFTAKLMKVLKNYSDITEFDLQKDCVIKASHGCGWNILNLKTQKNTVKSVVEKLKSYNHVYSKSEIQYAYLMPRFFIEEIIDGTCGKADVYMIRCIYSKPVSFSIKTVNLLQNTYNIKDNKVGDLIFQELAHDVKMSPQFDKMIEIAAFLGKPFEFVRIDFHLDENGNIYFSEFTFTPNGGSQVFPLEIEMELGRTWTANEI